MKPPIKKPPKARALTATQTVMTLLWAFLLGAAVFLILHDNFPASQNTSEKKASTAPAIGKKTPPRKSGSAPEGPSSAKGGPVHLATPTFFLGASAAPDVATPPEDTVTNELAESTFQPEQRKGSREPAIFEKLRNHRKEPIPQEVRDLTAEVTKDCTNDVSKARAIYNWITANIKYDTVEWNNIVSGATEYTHEHDPATVLERGNTVCIGYAWLFDDMCTSAGIESTYLIGDVRGYRGTKDDELVSDIKHAWSAVKTDGQWKLLDATWGARQEGESPTDYLDRADYYYDTPANQFVFDHLPESEEWQLLEAPVPTEMAFSVLPNLKPTFFTDGLSLGGNYTSVLGARQGESYKMTFGKESGTDVLFTLGPAVNGEKYKELRSVRNPNKVSAVIPPLPSGDHLLRVYSRRGDGPYTCSADFVIHAE